MANKTTNAAAPSVPGLPGMIAGRRGIRRPVSWSTLLRIASVAGFLLVWWALTKLGVGNFAFLPTPYETLLSLTQYSELWSDIRQSSIRVFTGFGLAILLGVPLGLISGWFKTGEALFQPLIETFRPVPPISFIPLAILLLPTSFLSIVFITFIAAFFPIVVSTRNGVQAVDPHLIELAKVYRAKRWQLFFQIIVPSALPGVFTGMAIGMGVSWTCVVAAEMISGDLGLGYRIWESYYLLAYDRMIISMGLVGFIGALSSLAIVYLGKWGMYWRSDVNES